MQESCREERPEPPETGKGLRQHIPKGLHDGLQGRFIPSKFVIGIGYLKVNAIVKEWEENFSKLLSGKEGYIFLQRSFV